MSEAMIFLNLSADSKNGFMRKEQRVLMAYFELPPTDLPAINTPAGEFEYNYHLQEEI